MPSVRWRRQVFVSYARASTSLKIRHSEGSDMCPLSTMGDLYEIIQESHKVLTF